ncbi:MAG: hypothetical protein AAF384_11025 [Pseudomonadota bacterium]
MIHQDLYLHEMTGWRALLTDSQRCVGVHLSATVESHLVKIVFRDVGIASHRDQFASRTVDHLADLVINDVADPEIVGDRSLLLVGLFPEQAAASGVPILRFADLGIEAYACAAERNDSSLYRALSFGFVGIMDVLQTLRTNQQGYFCLDPLTASELWSFYNARHSLHVLQHLTSALPAPATRSLN